MRTSRQSTTVARLRTFLGEAQLGNQDIKPKEFAVLTGLKLTTLQCIESGKLPLSVDFAVRLSEACNVDMNWLLAGDPKAPIRANDGSNYTSEHFALAQSQKPFGVKQPAGTKLQHSRLVRCLTRFVAIAGELGSREGSEIEIMYWKIERLIDHLQQSYSIRSTGSLNPDVRGLVRSLEVLALQEAVAKQTDWPKVDKGALAALKGPSVKHMDAVDAKRAAEVAKPSPRSSPRRRRKSA